MTLLNVCCSPKRAIVAVDTLGGDRRDNARLELSKLFYLPHANVVIAGRGVLGVGQHVFGQCGLRQGNFDAYAAALPEMCTAARDWINASAPQMGMPNMEEVSSDIAIAGWSDEAGEMRAFYCHRAPGQQEFALRPIKPYWLCPGEPWAGAAPPAPDNADKMLSYGQRQMRWWHQNLPALPTGGRLVIAELTRYTMNVTSRALLSAPASKATQDQVATVVGRGIQRGMARSN